MLMSDVKPGEKFIDPGLTACPPHHRVHVITRVEGFAYFFARHVATGNERRFEKTVEITDSLVAVKRYPVMTHNFDALIGDRVLIELVDGGRITTFVTAIITGTIVIDNAVFPHVEAIECEKSPNTTYRLNEIRRITRMGSAK